jgi:hypothetical protein
MPGNKIPTRTTGRRNKKQVSSTYKTKLAPTVRRNNSNKFATCTTSSARTQDHEEKEQ